MSVAYTLQLRQLPDNKMSIPLIVGLVIQDEGMKEQTNYMYPVTSGNLPQPETPTPGTRWRSLLREFRKKVKNLPVHILSVCAADDSYRHPTHEWSTNKEHPGYEYPGICDSPPSFSVGDCCSIGGCSSVGDHMETGSPGPDIPPSSPIFTSSTGQHPSASPAPIDRIVSLRGGGDFKDLETISNFNLYWGGTQIDGLRSVFAYTYPYSLLSMPCSEEMRRKGRYLCIGEVPEDLPDVETLRPVYSIRLNYETPHLPGPSWEELFIVVEHIPVPKDVSKDVSVDCDISLVFTRKIYNMLQGIIEGRRRHREKLHIRTHWHATEREMGKKKNMCDSSDQPLVPTYRGCVQSKEDAIHLLEACLRGERFHSCRRPRDGEAAISGNVFVWEANSTGIDRWSDGMEWTVRKEVGFEVGEAADGSGLMRKTISILVSGCLHHVVSYYTASHTRTLAPPPREHELRPDLASVLTATGPS